MDLFDTHCHLDVPEFAADRDAVLARTRAAGVSRMVVPAVDAAGWPELVALCRKEEGLFPALGMHPIYIERHRDEQVDELRYWIERERPVAIGEIGLDFFIEETDRERQQAIFEAQLAVAEAYRLPVLLHVRKAHDQVLQILKRFNLPGGIAHAFNGSLPQAEQYLALGFRFGFGGMLTYERSSKIRKMAQTLPLESIVLETDAPDMSPASHHGERNSPEYLPEVVQHLAALRGMEVAEVAASTTANALKLFGLAPAD
ncbi:MAG TPA: TatD family hydrolase [Gammaproteobacteria bacterium]|jgi:TatD DNase family protein